MHWIRIFHHNNTREREKHTHKGDCKIELKREIEWDRECEMFSANEFPEKIMVLGGDKKTAATIKDFLELFSCTGKQNAYTMILNRSPNYRTGHKSQQFSTILSSFFVDFSLFLFYVFCCIFLLLISTNTIHERTFDFFSYWKLCNLHV